MKDDKQYIKEVYKKYENKIKEKKEHKKIIFNRVINIAAIFIIAISIIIIEKDKKERIVITDDVVKNKEEQKLNTIGNFENFYNIMKNYNSNTELYEYVKENLDVSKSESLNSDISSTNIQENNVDESDIVKIDKNNIYYIAENKVVILDTADGKNASKISEIEYETTDFYPQEIYVYNNKLIVIGSAGYNMCKTEIISTSDYSKKVYENKKTGMIIYDVTDKISPKEERRIEIQGNYVSSRMIKNNIYFIANKSIYISNLLKEDYEELNEKDYMPKYKDTFEDSQEKCIEYSNIYYTDDISNANYLMTVGVNLDTEEEADIKTVLGAGEYVYSSEDNMYIAFSKSNYAENYEMIDSKTDILKFNLNNGKIIFDSKTVVDGIVNNQFSMDEEANFFRIATTIGNVDNINQNTSSNLYILNEKLEKVGEITGIAPNEKIYSVRYTEDKAYIVTFKQTDPLFVIDLSNPTMPKILGELKIPGYSTYLHPYDENHIIGFGYDTTANGNRITTNGLKMVMFDITDYNNPKEMFKVTISGKNAYSELEYNHKALLYSKEKNIIGFPIINYGNSKTKTSFQIYNIDLNNGFIMKGEILGDNQIIERVVFANKMYYALSKNKIKVVDMETLENVREIDI
mgnify:CR=1 FL=1